MHCKEIYASGASESLICENGEIKYTSMIEPYKLINFDNFTGESTKEYNSNWHQIFDRPYKILVLGGLG